MSTVNVVEATVRTRLLRGDLEPGQRIRQDELAAELGVSKIPVREALQRLAGLGLLRFEANRGARVPQLTAAEAEENFSLRSAIEPILIARAIPNQSIVDLAEAELALGDTASTTHANWLFHHALYRASGWTRGVAIAELLHAGVAPYVRLYTHELGGENDSDTEHRALLEACRERDISTATALLTTHLQSAASTLIEFLRHR